MKAVEINNLKKYYGKSRGVEDVSFSIEEGEIFGFIGPNGSGKSTTIRSALSLIFPTSGSIKIFGMDSIKNRSEIAKRVGYLPSEVFYYDNMSVKDLLEYSASFYDVDSKAKREELCELLSLDENKKIDDLSLGNKKKVGIVQGLQHSPDLIILDEPTSGLDPLMQQTFFEIIEKENKRGATVLFSSHILTEVKRLSDRIGIIKDGRIVDIGTLESLKLNDYKEIHVVADKMVLDKISKFEYMEEVFRKKGSSKLVYTGNINRLLKFLSDMEVQDVTINQPSIEDLFMKYFKEK